MIGLRLMGRWGGIGKNERGRAFCETSSDSVIQVSCGYLYFLYRICNVTILEYLEKKSIMGQKHTEINYL